MTMKFGPLGRPCDVKPVKMHVDAAAPPAREQCSKQERYLEICQFGESARLSWYKWSSFVLHRFGGGCHWAPWGVENHKGMRHHVS